ncbi:hypothetical protein CEXT_635181 [Caerostris extrusa]|uniref:Uncharacterized protein n=1 Tax=Caerostris extrusa TaxID=172846 RepID=A0AAV4UNY2_CAEEX|nr:hypothetical protein CEXT_635181 [Caerostris extrusa]
MRVVSCSQERQGVVYDRGGCREEKTIKNVPHGKEARRKKKKSLGLIISNGHNKFKMDKSNSHCQIQI